MIEIAYSERLRRWWTDSHMQSVGHYRKGKQIWLCMYSYLITGLFLILLDLSHTLQIFFNILIYFSGWTSSDRRLNSRVEAFIRTQSECGYIVSKIFAFKWVHHYYNRYLLEFHQRSQNARVKNAHEIEKIEVYCVSRSPVPHTMLLLLHFKAFKFC